MSEIFSSSSVRVIVNDFSMPTLNAIDQNENRAQCSHAQEDNIFE